MIAMDTESESIFARERMKIFARESERIIADESGRIVVRNNSENYSQGK